MKFLDNIAKNWKILAVTTLVTGVLTFGAYQIEKNNEYQNLTGIGVFATAALTGATTAVYSRRREE